MGGVQSSKKHDKATASVSIRKQIIQSDRYIKNCSWIFDLEEKIMNHKILSFENDSEEHTKYIFRHLVESSKPFFVFDTPIMTNFRNSNYPVDVVLGLYSLNETVIEVDLYFCDIFVGHYQLFPHIPCLLNRFLLQFVFYGSSSEKFIQMKHDEYNDKINGNLRFICCVLQNAVRKECIVQSFLS